MVQVPAAAPLTSAPEIVQTEGVREANVTGLPDAPPVAVTMLDPPTAMVGATHKEIDCVPCGVTLLDAAAATLLPAALLATTTQVTADPLVNPLTTMGGVGPVLLWFPQVAI